MDDETIRAILARIHRVATILEGDAQQLASRNRAREIQALTERLQAHFDAE